MWLNNANVKKGAHMLLPPLYKYLDLKGATLTLGNGTFKHAKPSDFNDTEDLTVQSIFTEDLELALSKISNNFVDVLAENVNNRPTCDSPNREKLEILQTVLRDNADAISILKEEQNSDEYGPIYDVAHMQRVCDEFMREINGLLQDHRVLCVTTHKNSEKMWSEYAENHRGIALRIEPNIMKDSKFQLFRPVQYLEHRPPFYDDAIDFISGALFGDRNARGTAAVEKIIYSKTLEWRDEGEYRLVIPLRQGEKPWNTLPYHPEEITELYLGAEIPQDSRETILALAQRRNPEIRVFQMRRDSDGILKSDRL